MHAPLPRKKPIGDRELTVMMASLMALNALAIDSMLPAFPAMARGQVLNEILQPEHEQLVRYIGCLAMAGPEGKDSWNKLLVDIACRQALVFGIVGRALKEHVFSELYFGADEQLSKELREQEERFVNQNGKTPHLRHPFLPSEH